MKRLFQTAVFLFFITFTLPACTWIPGDHKAPTISDVSISDKVVVISDCPATSVTVSAKVVDTSKIKSVVLWYRVGSDQPFASIHMDLHSGVYIATIQGADLQGHGYGAVEFYISAEDREGNSSKSPPDNSIQFLPCVNN
jgi:hypothetical protein